MNKSPDDVTLRLPAKAAGLAIPLMVGGAVLLLLGIVVGSMSALGTRFAMGAYLTAFMYCMSIALGALFFVIIQHLCRAGWSVTVRRTAELLMSTMPMLAVLFLPVLATLFLGEGTIYTWDDPEWVESHHPEWAEPGNSKGAFLSQGFFTVRALIYLGVWVFLARYFFNTSRKQDETAEVKLTEKMQGFSGPAVILFSLTLTFASFDWIMSMEPAWFSTMWGVYLFAGSILSALAAMAVMIYAMQQMGAMRQEVTVEHYHDFGKLIFGFITFWTYIAFSQFLLIWYANLPEETFWFKYRQEGGWEMISLALVFFHWLLPFLGTMSRHVRRRPGLMCFWGVYVLVMHFVDWYWIVMPTIGQHMDTPLTTVGGGAIGIATSLLCWVGMLGLFIGWVFRTAESVPLIPVRDPRLQESLSFHQV
jgi:hypothetical protein